MLKRFLQKAVVARSSTRTMGLVGGFGLATGMALHSGYLPLGFKTNLQQIVAHAEEVVEDPYKRSRKNAQIEGNDFAILSGTANRELAENIAKKLGHELVPGSVKRFADGETSVTFAQKDVIGKHCYIVQPTCRPVNDNYMQLVLMVSAVKRAGAKSVTVVTPYFGYSR